jgi:dihydropteroate synthase
MSMFQARVLHIASPLDAERELLSIHVDPAGIGMMTPKMQTRCIKLHGLKCRQANILKQEMLGLGGDAAVARGTVACSIDSTDVILIGTDKQLSKLCRKLAPQPFGLPALSAVILPLLTYSVSQQQSWTTSHRVLSLQRPLIMGILNITPDSFSDGNLYSDPQRAIERALQMAEEGADIIDIGGESTRPGSAQVSADDEIRRVLPVVSGLAGRISCALSVDTWKSGVAQAALDAGVEIINDISGFTFDESMAAVAAQSGAGVVLMHTRGTPQTMQTHTEYTDLIGEIQRSLSNSISIALDAGIGRNHIAVDPGIGFAKTADQNIEIIRRIREFTGLGLPILIGTSRKAFIGKTLDRETDQRLYGTAATVALAVANGASILRVHDVREMRDVADMTHAITNSSTKSC